MLFSSVIIWNYISKKNYHYEQSFRAQFCKMKARHFVRLEEDWELSDFGKIETMKLACFQGWEQDEKVIQSVDKTWNISYCVACWLMDVATDWTNHWIHAHF